MKVKYTYWMDMGWYVGYLDKYPEFRTQAATIESLKHRLLTFYDSIKKSGLAYNRRHGRLEVA
jgi:hypothetical protein